MRVLFEADGDDDWDAMTPPVPERPIFPVTLVATDPDGLSASVQGSFAILWEPQPDCEEAAPALVSWTMPEDQGDMCEVSSFTVGAIGVGDEQLPSRRNVFGGRSGPQERVPDPEARRVVLNGLEPGNYRFYVRNEFARGASGASNDRVTLKNTGGAPGASNGGGPPSTPACRPTAP